MKLNEGLSSHCALGSLQDRCARAEEELRQQTQFLAALNHELKNSLHCLNGFAQLLNDDPELEGPRAQYASIILRTSERLLQMSGDILSLSKAKLRSPIARPTPMSLEALLSEIFQAFEAQRQTKGIALSWSIDPQVPEVFIADESLLRQILVNLLGNALRFTDFGFVNLSARLVPNRESPEQPYLKILVRDTGTGISAQDQDHVFEAFRSVDSSGLGLSLSRCFANAMGGDLNLEESQLEQGSCFSLILPVRQP